MRNNACFILIIMLATLPACKEEVVYGCQVEDPVRDLPWLKEIVADLAGNSQPSRCPSITQARAGKKTVFYIQNCCPTCSCGIQLYDCVGNVIPDEPISHETVIWKLC